MSSMLALNLNSYNAIQNAMRYSDALMETDGQKTVSALARNSNRTHDAVLRDLNLVAKNPGEIRAKLLVNAITKNKEKRGFLIVDHTLLVKEYAKKMEGVSRQYSGKSETEPGINATIAVWTDTEIMQAIDLFTWQKGDQSKIKIATDWAIGLAQKIDTFATLLDGAFATEDLLKAHIQAGVHCITRFHANRVVTVMGSDQPAQQIREHKAFKFKKNERCIIRSIVWHHLALRIIALKIKHKTKGWITIFLATTMSQAQAYQCRDFYKYRWGIEVFIRSCKQKFGIGDCLARTLLQQEAHALAVFLAYNKSALPKKNKSLHFQPARSHRKSRPPGTMPFVDQIKTSVSYA